MVSQKQLVAIHAKKNNKKSYKNHQQRVKIPRKCTLCGSTVSKSRAREQHGERFVNAPFCIQCEREHNG